MILWILLGPGLIGESCKNNSALPFTQTETAGCPQFSIYDRIKGGKREMWKTETRKIVTIVLFDFECFADFAIIEFFHCLLWDKTTYSNHAWILFKEWTRPVKASRPILQSTSTEKNSQRKRLVIYLERKMVFMLCSAQKPRAQKLTQRRQSDLKVLTMLGSTGSD